MASMAYPLLRSRRRHRRRRPPDVSIRTLALAVLVLAMLVGGTTLARRGAGADPARLLADAAAALATGDYHAARSNARAALADGAESGAAHLLLARAALMLDDGLGAEAELDRARATGARSPAIHGWQAHARLLQGDPVGALAEARRAPADPYALRMLARSLAAADDPAGGQAALIALTVARPNDAMAWTDLGRLRLTLGDIGGAGNATGRAVALARGEPATLTLAGEIVRARFGLRAALPWFGAALRRDACYHPALIERAATLGELGRHADMLVDTRRALASRPGSPQALYLQAVLAARAGRDSLARRLLQLAGGGLDGVPGALLLAGGLDYRRGDHDQAVAKWRRLVEAQPLNVTARRLLALALLRSGDARDVLDVLGPMVRRGDADGYTLRLAARALERTGHRDGAAVLLDRAARGGGDAAPFASDTAVGALAAAASDAAGDPTYRVELIRGLAGSGDRSAAVAAARALVTASPGAAAARLALGDALIAAGRRSDAAVAYAQAADLSFDAPTMLRLVDARGRIGDGRGAAAALSLYLVQNPRAAEARSILGHWQVEAGDYAAAIATLEAVRRVTDGGSVALLADLARAYAGIGEAATALRHARTAYALAPMSPAAIDTYAATLTLSGDTRGAAQLAAKTRAIAGAPSAP